MKYTTSREFAKDFIRPYVLRGDSIESLASGYMGSCSTGFSVQIGGYLWKKEDLGKEGSIYTKKLTKYQIGVEEFEHVEVMEVFSLKELFHEIILEKSLGKTEQLELF